MKILLEMIVVTSLTMGALSAQASDDARAKRGMQVLQSGTKEKGKPAHFAQLEKDFPFLARITLEHSLGDIWARDLLDPVTRQLVSLSALAAQGTLEQFKVHAGYALELGAKPEQLMEVIHLVTVTSGFPRALNAAQALKEVFLEKSISLPLKTKG